MDSPSYKLVTYYFSTYQTLEFLSDLPKALKPHGSCSYVSSVWYPVMMDKKAHIVVVHHINSYLVPSLTMDASVIPNRTLYPLRYRVHSSPSQQLSKSQVTTIKSQVVANSFKLSLKSTNQNAE